MDASAMAKARVRLLLDHPFFAALCLRMPISETRDIETFMTDGASIKFNPDFAGSLSQPEVVGVLAHEVMHCALSHHTRRGDRHPMLWNIACDYAINPILIDAGLTLPAGGLLDHRFAGMSADAIYAALVRDAAGGGKGKAGMPGGGKPSCGEVTDAPAEDGGTAPSPADLTRAEEEWQIAVAQAAQAAKGQGKLPASLARFAEELRSPAVDWRHVLRRFMTAPAQADYRWFPPNRRFVGAGLYLPSLRSEGLGEVVVAIDTSGSIGAEELAQFGGELTAIMEDTKPSKVHVVYCDARVAHVDELTCADLPLKLTGYGGGGTDFRPPFQWVAKQGIDPACFIYLTDMMGPFPDHDPGYPVLWASTTPDRRGPIGETVYIDPR